jgi:hypothetical protein
MFWFKSTKKDSLLIFHAKAKEGKLPYWFDLPKREDPSRLIDAVAR